MAHIERYLGMQDNQMIKQLCENCIRIQVNASFFNRIGSRKKAIKLLESGYVHFIGSDCHNMTTRSPKIGEAYELISKKFGEDYLYQMNEYGKSILNKQ
jgi:protein-tyrosine phosphatase